MFEIEINHRNPLTGLRGGMQSGGRTLAEARAKMTENLNFYRHDNPDLVIFDAHIFTYCPTCRGAGEVLRAHQPAKRHTHTSKCYKTCPTCHNQDAQRITVVERWINIPQ